MKTGILLVDRHQLVLEALRHLIESQTDLVVLEGTTEVDQALVLAKALDPHVVLMDVDLPDLRGPEITRRILADVPSVRVLALSTQTRPHMVKAMLRAGASGYLMKDQTFRELALALRTIRRGGTHLCPTTLRVLLEGSSLSDENGRAVSLSVLSSRETEVLKLIARGLTTREIADHLGISLKTAETHRRRITLKLQTRSVAELTRIAISEGLAEL